VLVLKLEITVYVNLNDLYKSHSAKNVCKTKRRRIGPFLSADFVGTLTSGSGSSRTIRSPIFIFLVQLLPCGPREKPLKNGLFWPFSSVAISRFLRSQLVPPHLIWDDCNQTGFKRSKNYLAF